MSNSALVKYTNTNHSDYSVVSDRKIDKIILHHWAGVITAKQGCDYFATSDRQVSSNYVIGYDSSIGLSVDERYRPWTTGSYNADKHAVTIEVSNADNTYKTISKAARKSLVELMADIAKRNNLGDLVFGKNVFGHKDFASTDCPCYYDDIANLCKEANALNKSTEVGVNTSTKLYKVQVGAFSNVGNAQNLLKQLKAAGFSGFIVEVDK